MLLMGASTSNPKEKVEYTVLPQHMGGGPHNLGDPNDKTLRHIEKDVCIPVIMKERAKKERCQEVHDAFGICSKEQGAMMPFKCTKEADALKKCLYEAFNDPDFVDSCTQQYLKEREEFRRTGVPKSRKKQIEEREKRIRQMVDELKEQERGKQAS